MTKPQIKRSDIESILRHFGVEDEVAIVGIRGYYLDSFGLTGENDRGVYDDAIIVITPTRFETFQANTDPSVFRPGIATMKPGVHYYYKGKHRGRYWALRLVGETVPVTRDGQAGVKTGVALNIHKGGRRNTGSEGCQTIQPDDWDDFIELVYDEMDRYEMDKVPYVLVEEKERRQRPYVAPVKPAVVPQPIAAPVPAPVIASAEVADRLPEAPLPPATNELKVAPAQTDFKAFIPRIDTAKAYLRRLAALVSTGTAAAFFGGLPQWVVVAGFALLGIVLVAGAVILVKYHKQVFEYVAAMNALRASPETNNPVVTSEDPA